MRSHIRITSSTRAGARRDRVVAQPAAPARVHRPVRTGLTCISPPQRRLHGLQRAAHSLRQLPSQPEAPVSPRPAVVPKPEEVERLRPSLPALRAVRLRTCRTRLLRVQLQPESREPLPDHLHESHRVVAVLEAQHKVIAYGTPRRAPLAAATPARTRSSTWCRYTFASSGDITAPCGVPCTTSTSSPG